MQERERFKSLVRSLDANYPRVWWPEDRVITEFGRRSLGAILAEGSTYYLCCAERNLLVAYAAKQAGFPVTLVQRRIARLFQPVKIGTALELVLDRTPMVYIAAHSGNRLSEGSIADEGTYRMHKPDFLMERGWFEQFGYCDSSTLRDAIPGFDPDRFVGLILKRNSPEDLDRMQRRIEENRVKRPTLYC